MIDRRGFLLGLGGALVATRARADSLIVRSSRPQDLETPLSYFDRLITPSDAFFVRSHFGPPSFDATRKVTIGGLVRGPLALTPEQLKSGFGEASVIAVLQCAGSGRSFHSPKVPGVQWGHGAMGQAKFTGVRLADVLKSAGLSPDAKFVKLAGADLPPKPTVPAFVRSIPIERALDPTTIIAYAMNGEPLPLAHGGPLRLVVPGWAGDHWVKWLTEITAQKDEADGFFMKTGYRMPTRALAPGEAPKPEEMRSLTTLPVKSVIASPGDGQSLDASRTQEIKGCAFSGEAPIAKVEITFDDGKTWEPAKLEGNAAAGRWQIFRLQKKLAKGKVTASARASDTKGNVQPKTPSWNPSGYFWNGWHSLTWEVL